MAQDNTSSWWDQATAPPASGSFWNNMGSYMSKYGGPEFGIPSSTREDFLKRDQQAGLLDYIAKNQVIHPPLAQLPEQQAPVLGSGLFNMAPQFLAQGSQGAGVNAPPPLPTAQFPQQPAQQQINPQGDSPVGLNPTGTSSFNPNLEMDLAVKGGYLPAYMHNVQTQRSAMEMQRQDQQYKSNNMTAAENAAYIQKRQEWNDQAPIREAQVNNYNANIAQSRASAAASTTNSRIAQEEWNLKQPLVGTSALPAGLAYGKPVNGVPQIVQMGGVLPEKDKQPTEGMLSARGYLGRMVDAEAGFSKLPSTAQPSAISSAMFNSDNQLVSAIGNKQLKPSEQQYMQYASDWVSAKLRKESGAAIGKAEFINEFKRYFPQSGDSTEVIKQKATSREAATKEMESMAGAPRKPATQQQIQLQPNGLPVGWAVTN